MRKIIFEPKKHTYTDTETGLELMSVSHFRKIFDKTDWVHNVQKSAAQEYLKATTYKKYKDQWESKGGHILDPAFIEFLMPYMDKKTFQRICKEVRGEWDATGQVAAAAGTLEHEYREMEAIDSGFSLNPFNGLEYPTQPHGKKPDGGNETTVECLADLEPGFYPELILWHFFPEPIHSQSLKRDICGIAGTADRPYIDPDQSYVRDWKFTTKPLADFSTNYNNYGKQFHTEPWGDWPISKVSGYRIQLNTYGWMLEQHGLPPAGLAIDNKVIKAGQEQEFIIPYEGWRVSEAFDKVFIECL